MTVLRRPTWSRVATLMLAAVCATSVSAGGTTETLPDLRLVSAFPNIRFERPLFLTHAGDGLGRLFVVEQGGRIFSVKGTGAGAVATLFLDIRGKVRREDNEEGLLALAFHPRFKENGVFFVHHSASDPLRGMLERYQVRDGSAAADPASAEVLLEVPKPYGNHNGAMLVFGPDGYLYLSLGDGGAGGDPHQNGQNLGTLLGKILRIDVDHAGAGGQPYAIPADNPFASLATARPEIWAYGLRNVWRMSFDRKTGELWAGDVGQDRYEEIDLIRRGGNYGWNLREGLHPYSPTGGGRRSRPTSAPPADGTQVDGKLVEPVFEYDHQVGQSITGGYVYRGAAIPALAGAYVFADFVTGRIDGLRLRGGRVAAHRALLAQPENVASFGEDEAGELYVCAFNGFVYRLEAAARGPGARARSGGAR